MFAVIPLVFATYAATNIDNLLLLVSLAVSGADRQKLMLGFMAGMLLILLLSAGLGLVSMIMPVQYIGFLGIVPLLVGLQVDFSIAVAFLVSAIAWYLLAAYIGQGARQVEAIARYRAWLAPLVMIVLGLYILDNTVTDLVAGS